MAVGYGAITISDLTDGSQIWTTNSAPTTPNYTFLIANLVGNSNAEIKPGDVILYDTYRYTVITVDSTTVLTGYRENLKGSQGVSVSSVKKQYYLSTSDSTQTGGSWSDTIPQYVSGRFYWSRQVTTWSDGSTPTTGTPILEVSMTEALRRAALGLGMKINYSAFSTADPGEVYLHGYTNGEPADVDGYVYWKDKKRIVPKKMINPNAVVPYNRYIYIVLRLSSATSSEGVLYMVWYNSGWKYAVTPTPSAVGGTWTWAEATDCVLGQFIEPGSEQSVVEAYLYNPPRSASQVQTTSSSPYQYSQGAVEWYNSNGGNVVNAVTLLNTWTNSAIVEGTTEINGGYIKSHTIQAKHLATDAIMSSNFQASSNEYSPFSAVGTFLDLTTGSLYSPNFGIDNTYGTAYLNGEIIATSGRIGNSSATNYWEIGTKTDYNANQSAALIGKGTAYIQVGDLQLSNGLLDTRSYNSSNDITYPFYNNTYWDFGIQAPVLDTSTTGYVAGIDDNFIYIRNHANTIPALRTDWNYIFRVDKSGMIYINEVSLDDRYALKTDVGSTYLPTTGGTISGNLTVSGTLTATASSANQLTHYISINGTQWTGSTDTTIGTLGVGYGGTGATSFTSGEALIGNGPNAIQTRSIRNNTSVGALGWTSSNGTALATVNTLAYWNGRYNSSSSNLEYVKLGKIGSIVTHSENDYIATSGGTIDGSLAVTDLTAGTLVVNGSGRFTNGLYGELTGNAATATTLATGRTIQTSLGSTSAATFDGSANITPGVTGTLAVANGGTGKTSGVNAANYFLNALSTGSSTPVDADYYISQYVGGGTSTTTYHRRPMSALWSYVSGKISSVLGLSTSGYTGNAATASTATQVGHDLTIQLNGGTTEGTDKFTFNGSATKSFSITKSSVGLSNVTNDKQVVGLSSGTTNGHLVSWGANGYTVADSGLSSSNLVTSVASDSNGKLVLTYADNSTSDPIDVQFVATAASSVGVADALNVNGTAVGSATQPVYFNNQGKPTVANTIPAVTLNGSANNTPSFYAPTAAGTNNYVLKSSGSGAPTWVAQSTLSVGSASSANTTITLSGINSSGVAQVGATSRPTTANNNYHDNKVRYYLATSSMTTGKPPGEGGILHLAWDNTGWDSQLAVAGGHLYTRKADQSGTFGDWVTLLDSNNYTSYTVTKTGSGASGTWAIDISGNAATATKATQDGSGNVITSTYVTKDGDTMTGNLTISNTSPSLIINNTGTGTSSLELKRSGNNAADWKFLNNSGNFYIQNNYTSTQGDYFNVLTLVYNTGDATFKGSVTATSFNGNATSATKATQDGSGNVITSTYAPIASPTFTGVTTSPYYLSTSKMNIPNGKVTEIATAPRGGLFADGVAFSNPTTRNDAGWVRVLGTGESDTVLEIATGDDSGAGEQIVCRQYNTSSTVARELKLLDTSGNTSIPGTFKIADGVTLQYSTTTKSLDFVFA